LKVLKKPACRGPAGRDTPRLLHRSEGFRLRAWLDQTWAGVVNFQVKPRKSISNKKGRKDDDVKGCNCAGQNQ
jgi:hypothetical protein